MDRSSHLSTCHYHALSPLLTNLLSRMSSSEMTNNMTNVNTNDIMRLSSGMNDMRTLHSNNITQLQTELKSARGTIDQLTANNDALTQTNASLSQDLIQLRNELKSQTSSFDKRLESTKPEQNRTNTPSGNTNAGPNITSTPSITPTSRGPSASSVAPTAVGALTDEEKRAHAAKTPSVRPQDAPIGVSY
jgi:TolA-binding protein